MKIASIHLENFKRFDRLDVAFANTVTGDIANQFLVLGDNGTGKTSVLQAAALCLSMVSGKTRSVSDFDWIGWVPGRYARWGQPVIEIEVHFTDDEIAATREAAARWYRALNGRAERPYVEPGASPVVRVRLDGEHYSAVSGDQAELYQFRGRSYATGLLRTDPSARELFERLPGLFWFDQFRNLASPPDDGDADGGSGRVSFAVGVERLRRHLNGWQLNRLVQGAPRRDYLRELEDAFRRIFPGRSFGVPEPMFTGGMPSPEEYYFILNDGNRSYDIQEMSAGEQAVFPILYEFVRQRIRNSIVLIDEVDLNLHPPLAQALVAALPALGTNCQFLLTTHSEAVSSVLNPNQVHRLAGGRLCL